MTCYFSFIMSHHKILTLMLQIHNNYSTTFTINISFNRQINSYILDHYKSFGISATMVFIQQNYKFFYNFLQKNGWLSLKISLAHTQLAWTNMPSIARRFFHPEPNQTDNNECIMTSKQKCGYIMTYLKQRDIWSLQVQLSYIQGCYIYHET